jgi:hypothetical protein
MLCAVDQAYFEKSTEPFHLVTHFWRGGGFYVGRRAVVARAAGRDKQQVGK